MRSITPARAVAAAAVAIVTVVMVVKFAHHDAKDAAVWYDVGRRVLLGEPIMHLGHYRYPPAFAVFVAPLCLLSWPGFFFAWYGINVGVFFWSVRLAWRLVREEEVRPAWAWLPAVMVAAYAVDNLFLGQTNLLVTAFLYWSMVEMARGREGRAGALLAVTVATKAFTLPWLAYLVYRRQWRMLGSALAVTAFLLVVFPAPARGFSRNLAELKDWGTRVVAPYLTRGEAADWGQHSLDYGNQSLQAVLHRLLTRVDANVKARGEPPIYVNVARLSEGRVNAILLISLAALVAGFGAACGWRRPQKGRLLAAELGLSVIVLLLASAIAWTYFYVVLLLPIAVAVSLVRGPEGLRPSTRRLLTAGLWAQGLAVVFMARGLGGPYVRAAGSLCWAAVVLYLGLARACWEMRRQGLGARGQGLGEGGLLGRGALWYTGSGGCEGGAEPFHEGTV